MADENPGPALEDVLDDGQARALIGATSGAEDLPVGGATMTIGSAGTLIIVDAGEVPGAAVCGTPGRSGCSAPRRLGCWSGSGTRPVSI